MALILQKEAEDFWLSLFLTFNRKMIITLCVVLMTAESFVSNTFLPRLSAF